MIIIGFLKKIFYKSPKIIFINFYRLLLRRKIFNIKRLDINKPAILAINHITGADPIIVLAALKKKIIFLADSKCFETKISNFFFSRFTESIPVFKKHFIKTINTIKDVFKIINKTKKEKAIKNIFLGIFPEGKLNKKEHLSDFFKGTAYLSYKLKLPIIPIYISNIFKGPVRKNWFVRRPVIEGLITIFFNQFKKVHIFIGEPIDPMADNILKDFQNMSEGQEYKNIIEKIHDSLNNEFFKLENESNVTLDKISKKSIS
ncbi:MAG: lysophospholipid acyltransferase family protein [Actinomycetota bacterium]|nr:lysophospholipid acyltransferase family protein [Actinomycetota bacterium]